MKTIAIVPARCGSKGIPKKNLYPVCGKPLIQYCLESLKQSSVDDFFVSTDCKEVAELSIKIEAKVIDRPAEISQDHSPTIECINHAIRYLKLNQDDIVLTIQATSPLILSEDIDAVILKMKSNNYRYVISVVEDHGFLWEINNKYIQPKFHDPFNRIRRQDLKPTFRETGSIYATTVKNIIDKKSIIYGGEKTGYVSIPKNRSFEIDDYSDLKIIEAIIKYEQY
jgi:N-acylneuraminate cytidylyltransferase